MSKNSLTDRSLSLEANSKTHKKSIEKHRISIETMRQNG